MKLEESESSKKEKLTCSSCRTKINEIAEFDEGNAYFVKDKDGVEHGNRKAQEYDGDD